MAKKVPEMLRELSSLYEERNSLYGDNYKLHGVTMQGFFPNGIRLGTVKDYNRYSIFKEIVTRLGRYAYNFENGGHVDSLNDISVYAQMLQELDSEH